MTRGSAARQDGWHWHPIPDLRHAGAMTGEWHAHDWSRATGHPGPIETHRPHAHFWDQHALEALATSAADDAVELRAALAAEGKTVWWLLGRPQYGPSRSTPPGSPAAWLDTDDAQTLLHPDLRPPGLRDRPMWGSRKRH
jgi:hypothetical protein